MHSLELRSGVDVALKGTVVHVGAVVVHEWHDRLVLRTVPLDVARLPETVPVDVFVVLVVDRGLSSSPLSVRVGHGRVLWNHSQEGPVEQIRVVQQSLCVELMVPQDHGAVLAETTADTADNEEHNPAVSQPAADVEVLDWELSDHSETKEDTKLSSGSVVGPVEVGFVAGTGDHREIVAREPALKDLLVVESFGSPLELSLLQGVFRDTEANQLTILHVVGGLGVDSSSHFVIVRVLYSKLA